MRIFFISLILTQLLCQTASAHPDPEKLRLYQERQENSTPDTILAWLKEGNRRFSEGVATHGDHPQDARERVQIASVKQRPLAVILSCVDSRTSPEMVFDTTVGDLYTVRVSANVISNDILGSLEVSVASGAKVIVVLGHSDCGGIKGACSGWEFEHLTQILEKVKPAIGMTHEKLDQDPVLSAAVGERVVSNRRYIAEVSHTNALQSARQIREQSEFLRNLLDRGEITLVPALYDVETGKVTFDSL